MRLFGFKTYVYYHVRLKTTYVYYHVRLFDLRTYVVVDEALLNPGRLDFGSPSLTSMSIEGYKLVPPRGTFLVPALIMPH